VRVLVERKTLTSVCELSHFRKATFEDGQFQFYGVGAVPVEDGVKLVNWMLQCIEEWPGHGDGGQ
jgi:hypothetical protein